jgi:phosphohistidine phosphatase
MRRLLLLRHAKAERAELGGRDRDRALAKRGREQTGEIGPFLVRHKLVPEQALVSPAARTRQTWEQIAATLRRPPPIILDERLYNADADTLLEVVREADAAIRALVLVGHNPGLHEFALMLVATGDTEARARLAEKLPTGGLVIIEFNVKDWQALHPQSGRLDRFVTPRLIASATE